MNKIRLVLFDIDGTLINSDALVIAGYQKVFDTYRPEYKVNEEEKESFLGPTLKEMFPKYFKEDFETLLHTYQGYVHDNIGRHAFLYPGVKECLTRLRKEGYILGAVTSRFEDSCDRILNFFELKPYFDIIVTLNQVTKPKPSPEGINLCLEKYQVLPREALYIGDNISDVEAGFAAGVKVGIVSWAKKRFIDFSKIDFIVENFETWDVEDGK